MGSVIVLAGAVLGRYCARRMERHAHGVILIQTESDTDVWHFIRDECNGLWTWKRVSATGEELAESLYSFASFKACVADAEAAGFVHNTRNVRRVRSSEVANSREPHPTAVSHQRRRRPRQPKNASW